MNATRIHYTCRHTSFEDRMVKLANDTAKQFELSLAKGVKSIGLFRLINTMETEYLAQCPLKVFLP